MQSKSGPSTMPRLISNSGLASLAQPSSVVAYLPSSASMTAWALAGKTSRSKATTIVLSGMTRLALLRQAADIGHHVAQIVGLEDDVGHGGVRALQPDRERHLGHAGRVGDRLEGWGFRQRRHVLVDEHRVAGGANFLGVSLPSRDIGFLRACRVTGHQHHRARQQDRSLHARTPYLSALIALAGAGCLTLVKVFAYASPTDRGGGLA